VVGERNYNDFGFVLANNDRIGEASEHKTFRTASTGCTGQGCEWRNILLQNVECSLNSVFKIYSEPSAFFFIPRGSFGRFLGRLYQDAQCAH